MQRERLADLLDRVSAGDLSPEEALKQLGNFYYEDIGFARIDNHRSVRTGFPEVIFCQGKNVEQVRAIVSRMKDLTDTILATRATEEMYRAVETDGHEPIWHPEGKIIMVGREQEPVTDETILVVTAGTADLPVAEEAALTAQIMGNRVERLYDAGVAGIHRLLSSMDRLRSAGVLVVVAGMDGALPSVIGGLVPVPVIAVPTSVGYGAGSGGIAPLLTMLNSCAPGVTVVNIDNGFGAGYAASLINRRGA